LYIERTGKGVLGNDHFTAFTLVTIKTSGKNLKAVALMVWAMPPFLRFIRILLYI